MRRAKGYQDLDDSAVGPRPPAPAMPPPQEIEMASVSVVPDGKIYLLAFYISYSLFAYRILTHSAREDSNVYLLRYLLIIRNLTY